MRTLSCCLVGLLPLTAAHIAHADEPPPPPPSKRVAAAVDDLAQPTALATATVEPAAPRFPRAVIDRPMTYPAGFATAGFDAGAPTRGLTDANVHVLAGVGLTDRVEINVGHYAVAAHDYRQGSFDCGFGVHLGQLLDHKLDLGTRVQSGYDFDAKQVDPLYVGIVSSYALTPKLALITPGNQLAFGFHAEQPAFAINLPIALGYQASPLVYVQLDTTLASFDLDGGAATWMFSDTTPLALTAFVNVIPEIDVFAGVSMDLTPPDAPGDEDDALPATQITDTLGVLVGARYYFGRR